MAVAAFKVGALADAEQVQAVAEALADFSDVPVVFDPVLDHSSGEDWQDDSGTWIRGDDAPAIVDFVRRIGQDPRSARLAYFALNYLRVGNGVARALLDSPHLQPAEQLALFPSSAMGQAESAVQRVATWTTAANGDDGVGRAIEDLLAGRLATE